MSMFLVNIRRNADFGKTFSMSSVITSSDRFRWSIRCAIASIWATDGFSSSARLAKSRVYRQIWRTPICRNSDSKFWTSSLHWRREFWHDAFVDLLMPRSLCFWWISNEKIERCAQCLVPNSFVPRRSYKWFQMSHWSQCPGMTAFFSPIFSSSK